MTDLEMIKRCAEKMGYATSVDRGDGFILVNSLGYDPLHDDAQAMALVKKFKLEILQQEEGKTVRVRYPWSSPDHMTGWYDDLNRAIVECVAKLDN